MDSSLGFHLFIGNSISFHHPGLLVEKKNIKVTYRENHQSFALLAFVWKSISNQWIPSTKGQYCGKCAHVLGCHVSLSTPSNAVL